MAAARDEMKALVVQAPGEIHWQSVPAPAVAEGWARVEIKAVGICSSDVPRALHGSAYHYPIVLGHEMAGIVREIGAGVDPDLLGERVAVAPLIPCRRCDWCQRGRYSLCDDYDFLGSRRDGGCAESVLAPASNLVPLPPEIHFDAGALIEPASVVLHALRGRVNSGDRAVVLGAGPIGLLAVQLLSLLGGERVIAIDPLPNRLELAGTWGAIPLETGTIEGQLPRVREALGGDLADLVIVATGVPAAQDGAVQLVRKGGRIVHLGIPHGRVVYAPAEFERIVRHELRLSGSWNSYSDPFPGYAWRAATSWLASGQLEVEALISARLPLSEGETGYRRLDEEPESWIKILLHR